MNRGDQVKFKCSDYDGGRYRNATVLAVYNDNQPPALRLDIGDGGMVVRQSECELVQDYDQRIEEAEKSEAREKLQEIIKAWESGHRTCKAIAESLNLKTNQVTSKVLSAKRWGFIKDESA